MGRPAHLGRAVRPVEHRVPGGRHRAAHSVNAFANPAEWVPVVFSLVAPAVLVAAMALAGFRPAAGAVEVRANEPAGRNTARRLGLAVGWGSVAVGIAGLLFHLDSPFFDEQTLKNLVYTAPFAAPLAQRQDSASC